MDINRNNCETFFLLYLDRELNTAERVEVENFLKDHTDLQKEFSLLQLTKQWPGEIIFEQKEMLYHTEEKRRVIPIYWTRIAATLVLVLAGSLFMMSILRSHRTDISDNKQSFVAVNDKKNPAGQSSSRVVITNTAKSSVPTVKSGPTTNAQMKSSGEYPFGVGKNPRQIQNPVNISQQIQDSPDDLAILTPKSNATTELQTSGERNVIVEPGKSLNGTNTPGLVIEIADTNRPSDMANEEVADIQTDNSISVIALTDRNKGIAGFFKKLTQRVPGNVAGNATADNTKKLRVSVFQFSY